MWCSPNRNLIEEIFKGVWTTARSDASLFNNMWMPIMDNILWHFTTGDETTTFFLGLPLCSWSHRRKNSCQTPPHLAAELQPSTELVCACERVCIHQVPILWDLAHHLLPCVRSCCRGEPSLGQCLCLYHFPVPETDGHCLLQRKRKPKQSQTRRLKALLTQHQAKIWKWRFTWSVFLWS